MHTDEALLIRYLLGNLPEDEQERIEDRAFSDPQYLGELEAVEADLIDSYVRNELKGSDRNAFETRFLIPPGRRSKVEFAKALARVATEQNPSTPLRQPVWKTLFFGWSPALRFAAISAAIAGAVGISWLGIENSSMQTRIASLEAQRQEFAQREEGLRSQLAERQKTSALPAAVASLKLLPGLSRSESTKAELVIQPSAQLAHIEIQLEPRDAVYKRFRAELRTTSGEEVVTRGNLQSAGASVAFDIPTSGLEPGQYELTLKGLTASRTAEEIGFYYFQVRK